MTKTKTIEETTAHGTVEYEVVECDSCGNDVMKDEAKDFEIGEREGKACPHCAEVGPLDFPNSAGPDLGWIVCSTILWPLALLAALGHNEWRNGDVEIFLVATAGCLLWVALPLLTMVVL